MFPLLKDTRYYKCQSTKVHTEKLSVKNNNYQSMAFVNRSIAPCLQYKIYFDKYSIRNTFTKFEDFLYTEIRNHAYKNSFRYIYKKKSFQHSRVFAM